MNQKAFNAVIKSLLIFSILYLIVSTPPMAFASEFSVGIYPPLIIIQAVPPQTITHDLILENFSNETIYLDIILKPFTASETENGQPNFNTKDFKTPNFIKSVKILDKDNPIQSLTLYPKQKKDLVITIMLPESEENIDHYFSIQFISKDIKDLEKNNYSRIIGGISANVLLSIKKDKPEGFIREFSSPLFLIKGHIPFLIRITNTGNHFFQPQGTVTIKNIFGHVVAVKNLTSANVLRNSTRKINLSIPNHFLLGYYTATLELALSEQGPLFRRSISFSVLPIQSITLIFITILTLVIIYMKVNKRLKN